jgi:hypothetical protein
MITSSIISTIVILLLVKYNIHFDILDSYYFPYTLSTAYGVSILYDILAVDLLLKIDFFIF